MNTEEWLLCPICKNKTRTMVREDTELKNFPLFCPRCKKETLINVEKLNMTVIKEPDAGRRADNLWGNPYGCRLFLYPKQTPPFLNDNLWCVLKLPC